MTASAQSPGQPPLPLEALPARGWRHRRRRHALVSPKGSHSRRRQPKMRTLSTATSTLLRRLGHHNPDTTSSSKPMHSQPLIPWGCVQTQESCRRKCWRVLLMWTPIETNMLPVAVGDDPEARGLLRKGFKGVTRTRTLTLTQQHRPGGQSSSTRS